MKLIILTTHGTQQKYSRVEDLKIENRDNQLVITRDGLEVDFVRKIDIKQIIIEP